MLLDKISVVWFKNNEKYSLYFNYHFSFFIYIFLYLGIPLVWKGTHIHSKDLFYPKIPENIWENEIYIPQLLKQSSTWWKDSKNIQQHKRLEKKKKKLMQIRSGKDRL